ncbi:MAG: hypothetical protein RBT33_00950 [Candidatus Dojkabacteria bacterium]|jgi:hypothetical protein|nr:hypothetical protein [Candidatus Dojkabacteria bacterium]MDX9738921.1 hypothetical protein [Candidatus Dojkabacteria bacterium]
MKVDKRFLPAIQEVITSYKEGTHFSNQCPLCVIADKISEELGLSSCCASCPWVVFFGHVCADEALKVTTVSNYFSSNKISLSRAKMHIGRLERWVKAINEQHDLSSEVK